MRGGGLVKTNKFKSPKYVGDPINAIRIFNEKEVDELLILDIQCSKINQIPNFELISEFAGECFMPLCYGGGITNIDQASRLFAMGVEKICLQTSALKSFDLIEEVANKYGKQSVVVSLDLKKGWTGKRKLYSAAEEKALNRDWTIFLNDVQNAGAGEVLVNSVDKDGTMTGMDLDLISQASQHVNVPLIAAGGVSSLKDIKDGVDAGANAIAVGAFFVFHGPHQAVLITYPQYEELVALLS